MDGSQEALLDFYRSNLFRAEELIRVSTTSKDLDSNDPPSNPLKAVQFSALSLALVDCELRKAYGDFCGLISTHPQTAISRFKDFISTSIAWQKVVKRFPLDLRISLLIPLGRQQVPIYELRTFIVTKRE